MKIFVTLSLFPLILGAAEYKGVKVPEKKKVAGEELVLNGMGARKAYGLFNVYVGALWLKKKSKDPKAIVNSSEKKHLELHFLRFVDKKKLREAWKTGFKKNKIDGVDYTDGLLKLNAAMTNTKKGQVISMTFLKDGVEVTPPGAPPVKIKGEGFAKILLRVFLNDPPNSGLKKGLLGKT